MNKGVTFLILGVVLFAMALVFYSHLKSDPDVETLAGVEVVLDDDALLMREADEVPTVLSSGEDQKKADEGQINVTPSVRENANLGNAPVAEAPKKAEAKAVKVEPKPEAVKQEPVKQAQVKTEPVKRAPEKTTPAPVVDQSPAGAPSLKPLNGMASESPQGKVEEAKSAPAGQLTALSDLSNTADHTLKNIGLHFYGNSIYLKVEADSAFPYKVFYLPEPDRLVLDLPGNWKGVSAPEIPSNQLVTKVRVGTQPAGPRIVLDLSRSSKYKVNRISDTVIEIIMD